METTVDENLNIQSSPAPVRPQFLTVLCILTWISCGLLLIMTLWGVAFKASPEEQFEQVEKMREINPEMADQMEAAFEAQNNSNQTVGLVLNLVALALSAYGAYMMWQLNRTGFYVYLGGEIIPYFGFLTGGSENALAAMGGQAMAAGIIGLMVVLDLVFIGMYASNLKHMRR